MSQTTFAVPKDKQDVTVLLNGGKSLQGAIFLEYTPAELSIHHRIAAFLEDENLFFPLVLKTGSTELIHKRNVKLIELAFRPDQEDLKRVFSLMHQIRISAVFTDEQTINGIAIAEVPEEKARLSDILNLPAKFLNVKVDHAVCYINKDAIRKVLYAPGK